jgi:hypothetical protein
MQGVIVQNDKPYGDLLLWCLNSGSEAYLHSGITKGIFRVVRKRRRNFPLRYAPF